MLILILRADLSITVGGEGGNHAVVDGLILGDKLASAISSDADLAQVASDFARTEHSRWSAAVQTSTERLSRL